MDKKEKTDTFYIEIDQELYDEIVDMCKRLNISIDVFVNDAIKNYLDELERSLP